MFADDTAAGLTITDGGSGRATLSFTLKNKYTVQVEYTASGGSITSSELSTPYMQGSSITFAEASGAVTSTQGNRGIASFKYGSSTVLYKTAAAGATSVTINSANFPGLTSRTISLEAVLNLGSKPAPDAVGDIVFSDGTASAFNVSTYAASLDDGKANTDEIAALSDYNETNYPAFWYCTSYSAPGFTNGWYFPAFGELLTFHASRTIVEDAFASLGMSSPLGSAQYFSSFQGTSNTVYACFYTWGYTSTGGTWKNNVSNKIIPVRVFNRVWEAKARGAFCRFPASASRLYVSVQDPPCIGRIQLVIRPMHAFPRWKPEFSPVK